MLSAMEITFIATATMRMLFSLLLSSRSARVFTFAANEFTHLVIDSQLRETYLHSPLTLDLTPVS